MAGRHAGGSSLKWLLVHISEGEEPAEQGQSSAHFFLFVLPGTSTHGMDIWSRLPSQLIFFEKAFGASLLP